MTELATNSGVSGTVAPADIAKATMISDEGEDKVEERVMWGKDEGAKTSVPGICGAHLGPYTDTPTGTLHEEMAERRQDVRELQI